MLILPFHHEITPDKDVLLNSKMDKQEIPSSDLLYKSLLEETVECKEYFEKCKDDKSHKLSAAFATLEEQVENILPLLNEFRATASSYDFKNIPANGYRSFVIAADKIAVLCLKICKNVRVHRKSLFFHKAHYIKEIEECGRVFGGLTVCFQLLKMIKFTAKPGELFVSKSDPIVCIEKFVDKINNNCWFGRFLAFQYGPSVRPVIRTMAIVMSAYHEYYYKEKNVIQCAALCSQLIANTDLRAEYMSQTTDYRKVSADFCQHFWNMSEHDVIRRMNVLFFPASVINEVIEVPPEPIQFQRDNSKIDIPIPSSYIGIKPMNVRLISSSKRAGMEFFKKIADKNATVVPASDFLIFHVHGGGFVSHTSESHHVYLREWAAWTDVPILSVDYSLAPQAPYPRALEEILYAYVWTLNNAQHLGSKAKRIVFTGDSAGGNLCLSLTLKCIDLNLRKPDGLFVAYTPTVLQFYPCPSRLLGLMDPLLSFGFMACCTKGKAYVHVKKDSRHISAKDDSKINSDDESHSDDLAERNSLTSPEENDLSAETISSASPSELTPDLESTSPISDAFAEEHSSETSSLPSNYKSVIKGFITNLKEKWNSNFLKTQRRNSRLHALFSDVSSFEQLINEVQDDQFLSPAFADDRYFRDFPPTSILTVEMDPCIDDCVTFAKKLDRSHVPVRLDILKDLAHGFLHISLTNKEAYEGSILCAQRIRELLNGTLQIN